MSTLRFLFDFGSPNVYLAYKVLPEILKRTGCEVELVPCLLGGIFKATQNSSPIDRYADVPARRAYDMLEMERFVMRNQTPFLFNPFFPINTLILMRGAVVAMDGQFADRYMEVIMDAMWVEGLNLGDHEILEQRLRTGGLDGKAVLLDTGRQDVKDRLIENTERAVEKGVFGLPTFFIGDDMYFGKDRLHMVEEALASSVDENGPRA
jgi:2-hydroxychromene-2-carboxylate isomerase